MEWDGLERWILAMALGMHRHRRQPSPKKMHRPCAIATIALHHRLFFVPFIVFTATDVVLYVSRSFE
jgi:hypothetical protein